MSSRFCTYCGTANPATAAFCMSCGAPMQGPPAGGSAPLPGATGPLPAAPSFPPPPNYGYVPPAPPPRRHRWGLIAVVIIVAFLVIGGLLFFLLPGGSIQVTVINFVSPDNTCGLDGAQDYGFNDSLGATIGFQYDIGGNNTTAGPNATAACEIHSVSTPTAGFSISNANVPLIVPANVTSQVLSYTVTCPTSNFDGPLTIVLT